MFVAHGNLNGLGKKLGLSKKWRRNLQSLSLSKQLSWLGKKQAKKGQAKVAAVAAAGDARAAAADAAFKKQLTMLNALTPELATPALPLVSSAPKTPPRPVAKKTDYLPWIAGGAIVAAAALVLLPKRRRR